MSTYHLHQGDCVPYLRELRAQGAQVDLVLTSPPYNIGKRYERHQLSFETYLAWQAEVLELCADLLSPRGSLVWQVGNYVDNGAIRPLDIELAPVGYRLGLTLRNRVVWHFGHGLHCSQRFSHRYETALWFTKSPDRHGYTFDLDAVRVPSLYPQKKHFRGAKRGQLSGNPLGKNPADVWDLPNVNHNHREKTEHPCQFPVALAERFVLALTQPGGLVLDPFAGVATTGCAALLHGRRFEGCELDPRYVELAHDRLVQAQAGTLPYRPHTDPVQRPR